MADIVPGVHLSTMRDITDRVRAEEALADSERRFRTMAESAQDAIYRLRVEPELAFEYLNPAVTAISGFPVEAFHANPFLYLERAHPEDAPKLDPSRLSPGITTSVTLRLQHADGHWLWLEDNRTLIVEDGRPVGVQGVVRDITNQERTRQAMQIALAAQRRATERLRAADELKNAFLTAVSHELRTPLTSVLGYAETLSARGQELSPGPGATAARPTGRQRPAARRPARVICSTSGVSAGARSTSSGSPPTSPTWPASWPPTSTWAGAGWRSTPNRPQPRSTRGWWSGSCTTC